MGTPLGMGGLQQCFVNLCFFLPFSRSICGGFSCKARGTTGLPHPPRTPWAAAGLCTAAVLPTGDSHGLGHPSLPEGSCRARLIPHGSLWSLGLWCLQGAQQSLLLEITSRVSAPHFLFAHGSPLSHMALVCTQEGFQVQKNSLDVFFFLKVFFPVTFLYSKVLKHPSLKILITLTQRLSFK